MDIKKFEKSEDWIDAVHELHNNKPSKSVALVFENDDGIMVFRMGKDGKSELTMFAEEFDFKNWVYVRKEEENA